MAISKIGLILRAVPLKTFAKDKEEIMSKGNKPFEVEKSFGVGVLLKLTKKNIKGVDISTQGNKFISNLSRSEMNEAVTSIMQTHNIRIKLK